LLVVQPPRKHNRASSFPNISFYESGEKYKVILKTKQNIKIKSIKNFFIIRISITEI